MLRCRSWATRQKAKEMIRVRRVPQSVAAGLRFDGDVVNSLQDRPMW